MLQFAFNSIASSHRRCAAVAEQKCAFVFRKKSKRKTKATKSQRINRQNNYRCVFFFKAWNWTWQNTKHHHRRRRHYHSASQASSSWSRIWYSARTIASIRLREKRKSWVCNLIVFAHYRRRRRCHRAAVAISRARALELIRPNEAYSSNDQTTTAITNNCRLQQEQSRTNECSRSPLDLVHTRRNRFAKIKELDDTIIGAVRSLLWF